MGIKLLVEKHTRHCILNIKVYPCFCIRKLNMCMDTKHPPSLRDLKPGDKCIYPRMEIKVVE